MYGYNDDGYYCGGCGGESPALLAMANVYAWSEEEALAEMRRDIFRDLGFDDATRATENFEESCGVCFYDTLAFLPSDLSDLAVLGCPEALAAASAIT